MAGYQKSPQEALEELIGVANAQSRKINQHDRLLGELNSAMSRLTIGRSGMSGFGGPEGVPERRNGPMVKLNDGSGYVSLDQIPGRAVPYDLFVTIPIVDGQMGSVQDSIDVLPAGPFIAVSRCAILQSTMTVDITDTIGNKSSYPGRSWGRYRPISSAADIMDAQRAFEQPNQFQPAYLGAVWNGTDVVPVGNPIGVNPSSNAASLRRMLPNWPGNGLPIIASAMSMSPFRSMSFDGTIEVDTRGSQIQRQNQPVPSVWWTTENGGRVLLPTLDVFEPSETVTFTVTPTHVLNPAAGNIQNLHYFNTSGGYATFTAATGVASGNPAPAGQFPALAGQYDGHEGIMAFSEPGSSPNTTDPASRNFSGLLTVGYSGYYILQAPGVVR